MSFFDAERADAKWPANGTGEGEREGPEGLPDTSSSRISDYDGRSPGASVMDRQKQEPGSPQKKDIHAPSVSTSSYLKRDAYVPCTCRFEEKLH